MNKELEHAKAPVYQLEHVAIGDCVEIRNNDPTMSHILKGEHGDRVMGPGTTAYQRSPSHHDHATHAKLMEDHKVKVQKELDERKAKEVHEAKVQKELEERKKEEARKAKAEADKQLATKV